MKVYTSEELEEILALHKKWLNDEKGGERANLSSADLSSADLRYADLSSATLSYANLRSANLSSANLSSADLSSATLSYANLRSANLSSANLSSADLRYANLRYADLSSATLSYANLRYADLRYAVGEMRFIKSLQCEKYLITYTFNFLNIGCQSHLIENWKNFDDNKIKNMDGGALEWWNKWKPIIMQIIEMSPAEQYEIKEAE